MAPVAAGMEGMWDVGESTDTPTRLICGFGPNGDRLPFVHMHPHLAVRSSLVGDGLGLFYIPPDQPDNLSRSLPKNTLLGVFTGVWSTPRILDKIANTLNPKIMKERVRDDYSYGISLNGGVIVKGRKSHELVVVPQLSIDGDNLSLIGPRREKLDADTPKTDVDAFIAGPGIDMAALVQSVPTDHASRNCETSEYFQDITEDGLLMRPMLGLYTTREVGSDEEILTSYSYEHDSSKENIQSFSRWLKYKVPKLSKPVRYSRKHTVPELITTDSYLGSFPFVPEAASVDKLKCLVLLEYSNVNMEHSRVKLTATAVAAQSPKEQPSLDRNVYTDWLNMMSEHRFIIETEKVPGGLLETEKSKHRRAQWFAFSSVNSNGCPEELKVLKTAVNYVFGPVLARNKTDNSYTVDEAKSGIHCRWANTARDLKHLCPGLHNKQIPR